MNAADVSLVATCGSCDFDEDGYKVRCDEPAPYRAVFRCATHRDSCGRTYVLCVCVRHAATARSDDSLKRIYTASTTS